MRLVSFYIGPVLNPLILLYTFSPSFSKIFFFWQAEQIFSLSLMNTRGTRRVPLTTTTSAITTTARRMQMGARLFISQSKGLPIQWPCRPLLQVGNKSNTMEPPLYWSWRNPLNSWVLGLPWPTSEVSRLLVIHKSRQSVESNNSNFPPCHYYSRPKEWFLCICIRVFIWFFMTEWFPI